MCREPFWKQNKILEENFLYPFRIYSAKKFNCWRSFYCVLRLQSTNLITFSRSFFYFSQSSSFENEIVILIANKFQRSCQKRTWPAQTTIIWKIGFPMKFLTVFFYQFGSLSKNCVGLLTEKFRYSCQNCILLVRRIILDEETFFFKKECFYQFGLRAESSLTVADLFSALLTKLHFLSPEHYFDNLIEQF